MNTKNHQQIRAWLESEQTLDAKAEAALQAHLKTCTDCRTYAEMIAQLKANSWNPFPRQQLTQAESQKIVRQIRPQLRRTKMTQKAGLFNLSSTLSLVGLMAIVGIFAWMISQINQTAVSPSDQLTQPETASYTWYDGWETGAAFQFPASWSIANFEIDNGVIMTFATPLDETAAACEPYFETGQSAAALSIPFAETMPLTPLEFLTRFVEADEMTPLEAPQAVTVNGRPAAFTLAEIPCAAPFNQITVMTTATETHHVLFGLRHAPDGAEAARTELETMISSLAEVDYTGWQPWQPEGFLYTVMTPDDWNVFDALKSLQLTTSQQPMWSSFAVPNPPVHPNPADMILFHNLNSQVGDTPEAVVEKHIAQMEAELAMQQVEPPTAHPMIPGLVTAVYTTEDTAVFFGAIAYPRDTISLDPIGTMATVPLDQLDSFGDTFERVLRSLNGYHVEGVSIRDTIRGSDFAPTATPFPVTESPFADGESPTATPTPYDFVTVDPAWTATPFPTLVPQDGPLPITPTPTPAEFSGPNWTPTPFLPTPTSIPNPNEP